MTTTIPETISIPAGSFRMGARANDKFSDPSELPVQDRRIDAFLLGRFPVTNAEWNTFRPGSRDMEEENHPVTGVSRMEVTSYLSWLRDETGEPGWRLPEEEEWEYACRAGSTSIFPWGDSLLPEQANFAVDESRLFVGARRTTPVDRFPANRWGLHDMIGNVCEWTASERRPTLHPDGSVDPSRFVIRGGSWDVLPRLLRCSWRDAVPAETRRDNLGFRVAASRP